jgi:ribosomal-protein-alanine N-acetyltransferase
MKLDSERIYLKPLSLEELDGGYVNWLNDPDVCKYNSHGSVIYTREMAIKYIRSLQEDSTREVWATYLKEGNIHIGNISLQCIDKKNNNAEIAYLFGEKCYWGKGYAHEASKLLINRAFSELRLHRLYFGTHYENIAMQKLGEHLGFLREGVMRDSQFKNGKYNDVVIYGLVSSLLS